MKCVLLLFTFVALSYSYPYSSGRTVNISEDGTIVITGTNGKKIIISKGTGISGQKIVDISVAGPNIPTKRIQINEQNQLKVQGEYNDIDEENLRDKRSSKDSKKQRSQGDILTKILSGYQGDIDQTSYQKLLKDVNAEVQEGQLSPSIYDALKTLNQGQEQEVLLGRTGILGSQKQSNIVDVLRQQAIQQDLERLQEEQQIRQLLQSQQGLRLPVVVNGQQATLVGQRSQVLDVPVGVTQQGTPIIETVLLQSPQTVSSPRVVGLVSGIRGVGLSEQQGLRGLTGIESGVAVRDLLTGRPLGVSQGIQQLGPIGESVSDQLSQVIQDEREILDGQRQIQLQQLQQQQQQQQLLQQQLWQQQQLEQQIRQQQLLQQLQQPQWLQTQWQQPQWQQQLWEQQNGQLQVSRPLTLIDLLNSGKSVITTTGQQELWQQQPGGIGQGLSRIQRIPIVL